MSPSHCDWNRPLASSCHELRGRDVPFGRNRGFPVSTAIGQRLTGGSEQLHSISPPRPDFQGQTSKARLPVSWHPARRGNLLKAFSRRPASGWSARQNRQLVDLAGERERDLIAAIIPLAFRLLSLCRRLIQINESKCKLGELYLPITARKLLDECIVSQSSTASAGSGHGRCRRTNALSRSALYSGR